MNDKAHNPSEDNQSDSQSRPVDNHHEHMKVFSDHEQIGATVGNNCEHNGIYFNEHRSAHVDIDTQPMGVSEAGCDLSPNEWSLINNPDFSVHSFYIPVNEKTNENTSQEPKDTVHMYNKTGNMPNNVQCTSEQLQDRSDNDTNCDMKNGTEGYSKEVPFSLTEEPTENDSQDSRSGSWYAPSEHTLHSLRSLGQPSSLPNKLDDELAKNLSVNGHDSYESATTSKHKSSQETDQSDINVKTSLMSFWNNMKNGFTVQMKTNFKYDCPLWLLGCIYYSTKQDREIQKEEHEIGNNYLTGMDYFKTDFASKLWFTYRKDFQSLPHSSLTTDMGWGCMLRTGQMLLAQALVMHLLHRGWRYQIHKGHEDILHKRLLQFFNDKDSLDSPFSIHRLVKIGKKFGKLAGDWYGPSSVAHVMREAMTNCESHPLLSNLCLYVAQDCTIYIEDVLDLCTRRTSFESDAGSSTVNTNNEDHWRSVIILVPVRLGGVEFNSVYSPCVKAVLSDDMCLGIIGGKPKHSLYFVGYQGIAGSVGQDIFEHVLCKLIQIQLLDLFIETIDSQFCIHMLVKQHKWKDKLIYLDPHFCQDYVDCDDSNFSTDSFHCNSPRKVNISKMDPSCTIGFYCRTREDFNTFIKVTQKIVAPPMEKMPYPMFVFQEGRSEDSINSDDSENKKDRILKVCHYDRDGRRRAPKTSDDFVFL